MAGTSASTRTREHGGNKPSLPQTKCCTLCPAKFTRTTHLNRHLRTHTNDRVHRCDMCQIAEFTRSDLLTRHKRSCGRKVLCSRRKSCEACAESKIKCNLQWPCTKCTIRGRQCVFLNDPEESKLKKASSRSSTAPSTSPSPHSHGPSRTEPSSPSSILSSLPSLSPSASDFSDCESPSTCGGPSTSSMPPQLLQSPFTSEFDFDLPDADTPGCFDFSSFDMDADARSFAELLALIQSSPPLCADTSFPTLGLCGEGWTRNDSEELSMPPPAAAAYVDMNCRDIYLDPWPWPFYTHQALEEVVPSPTWTMPYTFTDSEAFDLQFPGDVEIAGTLAPPEGHPAPNLHTRPAPQSHQRHAPETHTVTSGSILFGGGGSMRASLSPNGV